MKSEDLGSAVIAPGGTFTAGTTGTWKITYTVGKYGIDDGGSIILTRRAMSDALLPQCECPNLPGYTTAVTNGDALIRIKYDNRYWIRPYRGALVVHVYDGSLTCGDTITVTVGDTCKGSPGWRIQTFPEKHHTFRILVDSFGTREYYPITKHPFFTIVPGVSETIETVMPSIAKPGEDIDIWVRALDVWGNPVNTFDGNVTVKCNDEGINFEETFNISHGVERAGTICFPKEGIYRVCIVTGDMKNQSNPVIVMENHTNIFWADLHGQTEATVGTGSVEDYFSFARDKALIDAAGWQGNDFQVRDSDWEEVCEMTKKFYDPGRFVTFLGYEWSGLTPAGGDHNILYLHDNQPIHRSSHWQVHDGSSEDSDCFPLSELWKAFRGRNDMMAIAHVGGRYANLDFWDEDFSGLVEIHSHHGTFEWIAMDALSRGLITGFVAQSDDHTGRPGLSAPLQPLARDFATFDVYGGYTGIIADSLTRQSLWDALRARHCYATTGRRIYLEVRSGYYIMGDIAPAAQPVDLAFVIAGTTPLLDAEVLCDTEVVYRYPFKLDPENVWIRIEWSGVRIKSRSKTADWDGVISVKNGVIDEYIPYAFDRHDQGVFRMSDSDLNVVSSTSGDIDGIFLKISGQSSVIAYNSKIASISINIENIDTIPEITNVGGVNLQVRMSKCTPVDRPENVRFTYKNSDVRLKRHAYWVRVVQMDGHMAWSSPVYFEPDQL
ncbi:MAG: DUF3604 domain-containing protein [Candidatus Latescibacteria bacterium]|nr:DUF3604 domain-containing protein [Candidatus Latescibacterota bacterium]